MGLGGEQTHRRRVTSLAHRSGQGAAGPLAHQLHAELVGSALGVGVGRQREAAPAVWGEPLLPQLRIQAARERHLHGKTAPGQDDAEAGASGFMYGSVRRAFTEARTLVSGGKVLKLRQACRSSGSRR